MQHIFKHFQTQKRIFLIDTGLNKLLLKKFILEI